MKHIYLILLVLIPCVANAEDGYWVCIGSFRDQDIAAQHRTASAHEFPDELRVVGADTSMGRYFRVLVGPYETALRANEILDDVRRKRPDAWLLVTSVNGDLDMGYRPYSTEYQDDAYVLDEEYSYPDLDDSSEEWEYRAPVVRDSGADFEVTSTAKIVEVAPPGYNVHRLNRGAARTDD